MSEAEMEIETAVPESGFETELDELTSYASAPDPALNVGGAGLFVPELVLGPGHLHPDDEVAVAAYLQAVARARHVPLHPCVAFNCLYLGWDFDVQSYQYELCGNLNMPPLVAGKGAEALPVGALVTYSSGTATEHQEWAEVLYKEGRPTAALNEDGLVRPAYSGAIGIPGTSEGDEPELQEYLVLDFTPFGPLSHQASSWLERARGDASRTYLNELGHVEVLASYLSPDDAKATDAEYFAAWMMRHQRELLEDGWLGAALEDPGDVDLLAEALTNALDAIEAVLERSGAFGEWNGYWYLLEDYATLRGDQNAPGGPSDAGSIVSSLARVPKRQRIVYRAFSPLLRGKVGDSNLRFSEYARHAVMTGALVAATLAERAPDGIYSMNEADVVLRLDDKRLYGGIWRAERLEEYMICSLVGYPPTLTLGLGASGEAGHSDQLLVDEETEPAEESTADPTIPDDSTPDDSVSPIFWTTALRESHRVEQRLHVDAAARLVPVNGTIVLRLAHSGDISPDEVSQEVALSADGAWLSPVHFPFDFFTGIQINCLARPGSSLVRASTTLLPEPVALAGAVYDYAFDRSLVDPRLARRPPFTLEQLAIARLARHGEDVGSGWRRLSTSELAEMIFGPDPGLEESQAINEALRASGRARPEAGGWIFRVRPGTARRVQREGPSGGLFSGASAGLAESVERARHHRTHRVVLHLRRLSVSEVARDERQAIYRRFRDQAPNRASLPETLPSGYTFVIAHTRGKGTAS